MTEVHDTNSTDADAETVMPGQSGDFTSLIHITHAPKRDEIKHSKEC